MVDAHVVGMRCAHSAALASAATQALSGRQQQQQPQRLYRSASVRSHRSHRSQASRDRSLDPQSRRQQSPPQQQNIYQQHQQHRANLLRSNSNASHAAAGHYANGSFSTPLRADNTFLNTTNATQSYPLHIKGVPYATTSRLQTLDVCLLRPLCESPADSVWIVYIHGGAWREPLVDSMSLMPAIHHLLASSTSTSSPIGTNSGSKRTLSHIAGFASINYRLSPYPQHPTAPSLTPTSSVAARHEGRNVTHPSHVSDVASALRWLRSEYGVGGQSGPEGPAERDWVAVGHSCGATIAFQLAVDGWLDGSDFDKVAAPVAIAGLSGLYNLPLLAENHANDPAYEEFLQAAFGSDEMVWLNASPARKSENPTVDRWRKGRVVVLAQATGDTLVEPMQREAMANALQDKGWVLQSKESGGSADGRRLILDQYDGGHDDAWRDGRGVARAIEILIANLFVNQGGFF